MSLSQLIYETRELSRVVPTDLDDLLANGWRHFGTFFFRQSLAIHNGSVCSVMPLRVRVADYTPTKSLRRIWSRNADLDVRVRPTAHERTKDELFEKHKSRFSENVPNSLLDFLSERPATVPCENMEFAVYDQSRLVAVSFLDVGSEAVSSVYAMFDPDESRRGLGIYTALLELDYATRTHRRYYYLGYAYDVPSHYDYKKRFPVEEAFNWNGDWQMISATP